MEPPLPDPAPETSVPASSGDDGSVTTAAGVPILGSVRSRLLRGSGWVLLARIVGIPLGLLVNGFIARMLTRTQFGAYVTCFTLVIIGSLIAQLGMDRAVVRLVAEAIGLNQPGRARQTITRVMRVGVGSALGAGILLLVVGPWIATDILGSNVVAGAIALTSGWLVTFAIQSLLVETYRGLQDFRRANVYDTILVDIASATVFGLMYALGVRHTDLRVVLMITVGITLLVTLLAIMPLRSRVRALGTEGELHRGEIYAIAWPSLVTNIASYLLSTGIDVLVLGAFRAQSEVAIYGAATRLVILVSTPLWILRGVLPPLISELHALGRTRELERTLRAGATLAGLPSFLVLVAFLLFGGPIMGIAFGPDYSSGAAILSLLAIGRMVAVYSGASGVTLLMTGHQKAMMTITLCTGAASVLGGIVAAPRFGAVGVATATMIAAIGQNALQLWLVHRDLGVWSQMEFSPRALRDFFLRRQRSEGSTPET
jgi:O-antigen/teichoic acid export membrane protein